MYKIKSLVKLEDIIANFKFQTGDFKHTSKCINIDTVTHIHK